MGAMSQWLEEQAEAEYKAASCCPDCGAEREEVTVAYDTFWICYACDERRE
jgi:ribosomal protein L37AE/L43A